MKRRALAGLAVAVLAISWGAPLARLAVAAPLAIAMWRMLISTAIIAPIALVVGGSRLDRRHWRPALLASAFLGLHFGLWIPSLWLTSVTASVVLVTTQPLWVLLLSPRLLGAPIRPRSLISFALGIMGVAVIVRGDLEVSPRALAGDAMALAAAVCMAAYLVIGKRVRPEVPLVRYLTVVYGGAAAVLWLAVVILGVDPWPENASTWLFLVGLAVGPSLVGHTLLNWALAHLEAYRVNLAVLLEPVGATLLTWLVIGERPPLHVLPGAGLIIVGLALEFLFDRGSAAS